MKIYISCDIEGLAGITSKDETNRTHADHAYFARQMTREAAAACQGALEAGATEIWLKDAHGSGRNLIPDGLPREVRLIRGWSGHPYAMMQEIDHSFDAAFMVGYHSMAQSADNPLAHTNNSRLYWSLTLNGMLTSEFMLNSYTAAREKVPVCLVTGDEGICAQAEEFIPGITTKAVVQGAGLSTISLHPEVAAEEVQKAAYEALTGSYKDCLLTLPDYFEFKIAFKHHADAYRASFFPGMRQTGPHEVTLESNDYFEVLRALRFMA